MKVIEDHQLDVITEAKVWVDMRKGYQSGNARGIQKLKKTWK